MNQKDWSCVNCSLDQEQEYPEIFDTIIIGAGPAGMTASIYAARRKMKTLLICGDVGGQLNHCSDIENWTGVAKATGPELFEQFFHHVKQVDDDNAHFDLWVREKSRIEAVAVKEGKERLFEVETGGGKHFLSRTIICCVGKVPRTLGVLGEKEAMNGNGLSFSATSDAPLYKGKKMVVIGGGNSAMDVTLQLTRYTDDITIMTNIDHLIGEGILQEKVKKHESVTIVYNTSIEAILLENGKVSGVRYSEKAEEGFEAQDGGGESKIIECEGIFEEVGQIPATDFLKDFITLNGHGEIPVNRRCGSEIPGFFACGDCTDQAHKQTIVAAGEGAIGALEAHEYVLRNH